MKSPNCPAIARAHRPLGQIIKCNFFFVGMISCVELSICNTVFSPVACVFSWKTLKILATGLRFSNYYKKWTMPVDFWTILGQDYQNACKVTIFSTLYLRATTWKLQCASNVLNRDHPKYISSLLGGCICYYEGHIVASTWLLTTCNSQSEKKRVTNYLNELKQFETIWTNLKQFISTSKT